MSVSVLVIGVFLHVFCDVLHISTAQAPHIILIVADDLGWNDVSFHGSDQIPTPNIDALAYNGVILNSHYVQSTCTPSRSALLTGKYPTSLGMQGLPLVPGEPRALPEGKLLPEYLKELGYATHLVGKWHLGYTRWRDTPTNRGFDHHFGILNGFTSYYDYLTTWKINDKDYTGFALKRDKEPAWDVVGQYATDAFTESAVNTIQSHDISKPLFMYVAHTAPHAGNAGKLLEAPQETINKFKYIPDSNRRTYAAMVSKLDDSVGAIVDALNQKQMLQNSVIVFMSDNGAPTTGFFSNWGSNYPLKGIKQTLLEGGIRSASFIWSPLILQNARVSTELVHISDWLPTLYSAAGGDFGVLDPNLDGVDQWSSFVYDLPSARNDILLNIDDETKNAGIRFFNWKLNVGSTHNGTYNKYFGVSGRDNIEPLVYNTSAVTDSLAGQAIHKVSFNPVGDSEYEILRHQATLTCLDEKAKKTPCNPSGTTGCLYDIPNDPCEENDLAKYFPTVVRRMKRALVEYKSTLVPPLNQPLEIEKADPKLFQYTWNPWRDCLDSSCNA